MIPISPAPGARTALIRLDAQTGSLRERRYEIAVLTGPDTGKKLELAGTTTIGSSPDTDFPLTDPTVSRYHLELQVRVTGVRLRDVGSTNGTFLSGVRLQEVTIEKDATVLVGATPVRIQVLEKDLGKPISKQDRFGDALGTSPAMRQLFGILERVAATDSSVLLIGETGTGKEVLARGIHGASPRRNKPFIVVECGALAAELVESELFGHRRGSFTEASADRPGAFAMADGGTLFLDEVGELPLELQPKLLRALDTGTVKRLGDDDYKSVDVRVVAATHRDLEAEVDQGRFRSDLFYRLAVVAARIPPLRERREDLPLLAHHFLQLKGRADFELPQELLERLSSHTWPGNARELRNLVERATAGADLDLPSPEGDNAWFVRVGEAAGMPFKEAKDKLVEAFTRDYIAALLERCDGNISEVARVAGIARNYVHKLVKKYGLKAVD
jgi:two-component system, NtrC family, response regulator GlrR